MQKLLHTMCGLALTGLLSITSAQAEDCTSKPSANALAAQTKLTKLVDDGLVQFAGYLAMVSYAREKENCADKKIYETLYVEAKAKLPDSKMRFWGKWAVGDGIYTPPRAALNDGFGGECTVKFDLLHAGAPQNVKVSCSNPLYKSSVRKWMKTVMFAPQTLDEGFPKEKGLEREMDFSVRVVDWFE